MGAFFKHENVVFNGEQEKESISHVRLVHSIFHSDSDSIPW